MALDGELFAGRGRFQHTVSVVRRQNAGELWRGIKFIVFDAPSIDGAGFEARLAAAAAVVNPLEFVDMLPHVECRGRSHLEEELQRIEKLNGEGVMMRKKNSHYVPGRTTELLKVKTFLDDEAIVVGIQAGKGRNKGRMGALECKLRNGKEFRVGSGFSDVERKNPPSVGDVITVRYFELTKAGVPRFPTFMRIRKDVGASEFD
uniref:DNA ligase OB-like domain-containing protein n=1 Tax=Pseudictyota dubia TaxID=2749911 RepID=A0A6U2JEG2_9STRA|mmetsp:Transcript_903/g.1442  ORF Transcript_903/g.1442 Transcript_903/m.1442 type:complete len:204 (+) Transcript_903:1082-1693(+)